MEFEKIILCVIGGILIVAFIAVCIIKHRCLPSSDSNLILNRSRSKVQVGAKGIVIKIPKNNSYENMDYVANEML